MKNLLKKLKEKRLQILKQIKKETNKKTLVQLQEDREIISIQIKKGKKIINALKEGKNSK